MFSHQLAMATDLSASLCGLHGLTHLDLSGNGMNDAVLSRIASGLNSQRALRHLDLSHNELRLCGVDADLAPLTAIEALILSDNVIEDSGLIDLSRYLSRFSGSLSVISLAGNRCGGGWRGVYPAMTNVLLRVCSR